MYLFLRIGLEETGPSSLDVLLNDVTVKTLDAEHANYVMEVGDLDAVKVIPTPA